MGPKPDLTDDEYLNMYFGDSAIEEYDEDDFYYHMYFDEVSTTPLPIDDFYDILESVSAGSEPQVLTPPASEDPPDYTDYFGDYGDYDFGNYDYDLTKTLNDTLEYFRNRVPRRVAGNKTSRTGRNNGKMLRFKRDTQPREKNAMSRAKRRKLINGKKAGKRLRITKVNNQRNRVRRRKVNDPRVIGILDRRTPELFRQSSFVTIKLTKFVVLSTGVTNAAFFPGRIFQFIYLLFFSG